jgi:hypothetical protein
MARNLLFNYIEASKDFRMARFPFLSLLAGIVTYMLACDSKHPSEYFPKFPNEENILIATSIMSVADCSGPQGTYTTEVHSTDDGYVFFRQDYTYRNEPFIAVVYDSVSGYSLDTDYRIVDTLDPLMIGMVKGHAFCRIALDPEWHFNITGGGDMHSYRGDSCLLYDGMDRMGRSLKVYINPSTRLLAGYIFHNPFNETEKIETVYRSWMEIDALPWPDTVEIIQAARDTFTFVYREILINSGEFERLKR